MLNKSNLLLFPFFSVINSTVRCSYMTCQIDLDYSIRCAHLTFLLLYFGFFIIVNFEYLKEQGKPHSLTPSPPSSYQHELTDWPWLQHSLCTSHFLTSRLWFLHHRFLWIPQRTRQTPFPMPSPSSYCQLSLHPAQLGALKSCPQCSWSCSRSTNLVASDLHWDHVTAIKLK